MPDLQHRFHEAYGAQGLSVVALDPDRFDAANVDALSAYVDALGPTFPVGLETTRTYDLFSDAHDGVSPFPVDVVVDQDGVIRYIAREYDPDALEAVIVDLLGR